MPSLKHWVWLAELRGLNNQARLALLRHFGDPAAVYYAPPEEILLTEGIAREQAAALEDRDLTRAVEILAQCRELGIRLMTIQDAEYPDRLKNIYDPPMLLYVRGRLPAMDEEVAVAAVGTRSCTPYGASCAEKLGFGLAKGGAVVVSGMARGIDAAAAQGALRGGGVVVGVLGGGLDVVYPSENRYLLEDVAAAGALISEYPPGTRPYGKHFPVRNRILSGLSLAVLVVEAPVQSGALITANAALEQGRDLFAVPGPINAPASAGCNRLIQECAGLTMEAGDILETYRERFPEKVRLEAAGEEPPVISDPPVQRTEAKAALPVLSLKQSGVSLTDDQIILLRLLTEEPQLADDLIEESGIPTRRVLSALTVLELEGLAAQHSSKRYTRTVNVTE